MKDERERSSTPEDVCDLDRLCVLTKGHSGDCYNLTPEDVVVSVLQDDFEIGDDGFLRANSKDLTVDLIADSVVVALVQHKELRAMAMQAEMRDSLLERARSGNAQALALLSPWDRALVEFAPRS
jgi:hypothetical protein